MHLHVSKGRLVLWVLLGGCATAHEPTAAPDAGLVTPAGPEVDGGAAAARAAGQVRYVLGLEEPLVSTRATSPDEDVALDRAASTFSSADAAHVKDLEYLAPLEVFVAEHPDSGWTPAVLTNLGLAYYRHGYFSRTLAAYEEAWRLGQDATDPKASLLVDRALGELARMHARVGHVDELENLFAEVGERKVAGSATEALTGAREGHWIMRHDPGEAFRCGSKALRNVVVALGGSPAAVAKLEAARSGDHGFSLADLVRHRAQVGVAHRLVQRSAGQEIPVPSVIHWRVHHYAALVAVQEDGRYLVQDPTFGGERSLSRAAIEAETSGYFLVPDGTLDDARWRSVSKQEARHVYGMGITGQSDPGAVTQDDLKLNGACDDNLGMCAPNVHLMHVSLNLNDTPIGYTPPRGPAVFIKASYNQREATQPQNFSFGNLNAKWTLNVFSYVQDDLSNLTGSITRAMPGGGGRDYAASGYKVDASGVGAYAAEKQTGDVLVRIPASLSQRATEYQLWKRDGGKLIYKTSDGATVGVRRMFLSAIQDATGDPLNALTLTYGSPAPGTMRLESIKDALGQVTTFTWGTPGPFSTVLLLQKITDPFGRVASFTYAGSFLGVGLLDSITDVIGIKSSFGYSGVEPTRVNRLTTPHGVTKIACQNDATINSRSCELTDPLGHTERVEFRHSVPDDVALSVAPAGMAVSTVHLQHRNTFYWDEHVYPQAMSAPNETAKYNLANLWHWMHADANTTSPILQSQKAPLESRVWYEYAGQWDLNYAGPNAWPVGVGRVLDDGSKQLVASKYDANGRVLSRTDPVGRVTRTTYSGNDLAQVEQLTAYAPGGGGGVIITTNPVYTRVAGYTYDAWHRPISYVDAAGQTWRYTYNAAHQLITTTDPLGKRTLFGYDTNARLKTITNANGKVAVTFSYDANCFTSNPQHRNCFLPDAVTDSEGRTLSFERDALDRTRVVRYPDGSAEYFDYTQLDLTSYADRLGRITTYGYDAARRLTSVVDSSGRKLRYDYYDNGKLKALTDENGNVTRWTIDIQGRPTLKTFADGSTIAYAYDAVGLLASTTDALGRVKTFTYRADEALSAITYAGGSVPTPNVSFTYDLRFPRLLTMQDGNGMTKWTYVPLASLGAGELASEDGPFANDLVSYGYDQLARVSSVKVGDTAPETWTYDALGRRIGHTTALGTFTYTFLGETSARTAQLRGSAVDATWSYDTNTNERRLKGITGDALGMTFVYDHRVANPAGSGVVTDPYQVHGITQGGTASGTLCYDYAGEALSRVTKLATGVDCVTGARTPQHAYSLDPARNVADAAVSTTFNNLNQITSRSGMTFIHDAVGNLVNDGARVLTWDADDRLVRIASGATTLSTIKYDGLGRRIELSSGGVVNRFSYCNDSLCAKRNGNDATAARYYEEGQYNPSLNGSASEVMRTLRDRLGSVHELTAVANGTTRRARFEYTPYGKLIATTPSSAGATPDFMYAGLYLDRATGYYYSQTRVYDPTLLRWLSRDPIAERGGVNLYAYVEGDPINAIDPEGLNPVGAVAGAFAGGVGGYVTGGGVVGTVGGAVVGALVGMFAPHLSGAAGVATAGAFAGAEAALGQVFSNWITGQPPGNNFSWGAVAGASLGASVFVAGVAGAGATITTLRGAAAYGAIEGATTGLTELAGQTTCPATPSATP